MIKRKCKGCAKKIDRQFNFCPWCGSSTKMKKEEDFGLFGKADEKDERPMNQGLTPQNLPFGIEKMMKPLIKQLEKELSNINRANESQPRGFNIKIQTGFPQNNAQQKNSRQQKRIRQISPKEAKRRSKLPRVDTESKVKRLSNKIIYELETPGVSKNEDISISRLEDGYEIKAYSEDKCFTKTIPFRFEILGYQTDGKKTQIEFREE